MAVTPTRDQALDALHEMVDELDSFDRKEVYWSILCHLADTNPQVLIDAIDHIRK